MPPTLVVLAAGLGSRFGGAKQLTPVGPGDELILDYNAAGAAAAGFDRVVIVTRAELAPALETHTERWPVPVTIVCQDLDPAAQAATDAGRRKPLGTVHATLVGMRAVAGTSTAVVNADDLYGGDAFALLAPALAATDLWSLVTFPVSGTLIGDQAVTRALCDVADGQLRAIEEGTVHGSEWEGRSGRHVHLTGDEPVSMNCWGFPASAAADFQTAVDEFMAGSRVDSDDEILLPDSVRSRLDRGANVRAVASTARCIGVTHPEDLVVLRALVTGPAW